MAEQTPGAAVLTIHTNVPAEVIASRRPHAAWAFAAMFGVGFVGLVFGRKTRYSGRVLMMICVVLVLAGGIAGMSACGTGKGPDVNPPAVTPQSSYTVTVTGQHGGNNTLVSLPFTFTLKVN